MTEPRPFQAADLEGAFALLAEMTQQFADAMDLQKTLERGLESIAQHVGAEAGSLWLLESEDREIVCQASVGPNPITGLRLGVSEGIVGKSVRDNACQTVFDVSEDADFSQKMDQESGFVTHSILCAPMRFADRVIGAVELINKSDDVGHFTEADAHLLQVLASSAGLAVSNARLAAAQVENERVRRELELAAEIQRSLLPAPGTGDFPVHGVNLPARTVSGDFFDILPLSEGRIAFCLGDVSGKGMNAALLMAKTASLYRCLCRDNESPGALLARLNDEICDTATRGMFVTMAAGIYDPGTGSVRFANAGHEPPLFHGSDGRFADIPADAPPLGILPGMDFPENDLDLTGGSLYLCSDGLTEAMEPDGSQLGREGLQQLVERFADTSLSERIDAIARQADELELRDDLTLLGVSDEMRGVSAGPERVLELRVPARAAELKHIRAAVRRCAAEAGMGATCAQDVVMAVDEACQNVIRHAYGEQASGDILLEVDRDGDRLIFGVKDFAAPVDPSRVRPRDLGDVRPGGLGTHLIQEVMDSAGFVEDPPGCGNLLRMVKRIR